MAKVEMPDRVGVETVAGHLYEGVSKFHAAIGPNVDQSYLKELRDKLHKQAQECCYEKKWEESLNTFMQVLAISEKLPPSSDEGYRGILVHNIGFCLHCLGELEAAKAYYLQSIECLERERAETPVAKKVLNGFLYPDQLLLGAIFGTAHDNRIRMTKERLVDIAFGRTPDLKMLDGWGRKRDLPDKSTGETRNELSRKWEMEGPLADGEPTAPQGPAWLAATQGALPPRSYLPARQDDGEPLSAMPSYGEMEKMRQQAPRLAT